RRLWRGESIELPIPGTSQRARVRTLPRPIQRELPIWITSSGSAETWIEAGRRGYNVLSALLQGSLEDTAENVAAYRAARESAGLDPEAGWVTLMMHTFIGDDEASVRARVKEPLTRYLEAHLGIYEANRLLAGRLPIDVAKFSADDKRALA